MLCIKIFKVFIYSCNRMIKKIDAIQNNSTFFSSNRVKSSFECNYVWILYFIYSSSKFHSIIELSSQKMCNKYVRENS